MSNPHHQIVGIVAFKLISYEGISKKGDQYAVRMYCRKSCKSFLDQFDMCYTSLEGRMNSPEHRIIIYLIVRAHRNASMFHSK